MLFIIEGSSQGELNTEKTNPLLNYSTNIGTVVAACCGCCGGASRKMLPALSP